MSLSIAAHELIYTADACRGHGRLHHLAFWVDTREECLRAADLFLDHDVPIEAAPSKHAIAQGFFLYVYRAGRQPRRGHHRHPLRLRPRVRADRLDSGRTRARAGLGGQDDRDLPHLRHAAAGRDRRAADPTHQPDLDHRRRHRGVTDDRLAIRDLIENWALWRDAGDWERFRTVWHDDGVMMATWFQGPATSSSGSAARASSAACASCTSSAACSVDSAGDRAIAQTKMTISQRAAVEGVVCDVVCTGPLLRFLRAARRSPGPGAAPADL